MGLRWPRPRSAGRDRDPAGCDRDPAGRDRVTAGRGLAIRAPGSCRGKPRAPCAQSSSFARRVGPTRLGDQTCLRTDPRTLRSLRRGFALAQPRHFQSRGSESRGPPWGARTDADPDGTRCRTSHCVPYSRRRWRNCGGVRPWYERHASAHGRTVARSHGRTVARSHGRTSHDASLYRDPTRRAVARRRVDWKCPGGVSSKRPRRERNVRGSVRRHVWFPSRVGPTRRAKHERCAHRARGFPGQLPGDPAGGATVRRVAIAATEVGALAVVALRSRRAAG